MNWWLTRPGRALSERRAIAELEHQHPWLRITKWVLTSETRLSAEFEIEHLGKVIPLVIIFPSFFPDMPPQVKPREAVRISGHQYGAGGELCLEHRPDNWDPACTGAMMIESAYRLIAGETPLGGANADVQDAHRETIGQSVRGSANRFLLPADARGNLASIPPFTVVELVLFEHLVIKHWIAVPARLGTAEAPFWVCGPDIAKRRSQTGYAVRIDSRFRSAVKPDYDFVEMLAATVEHDELTKRLQQCDDETFFLIECGGDVHVMSIAAGTGKRTAYHYRVIDVPTDANRLPSEYGNLSAFTVAIVGCGSVGSKIAASLARAGVDNFVLVDGDILFPGNLVRNDLDWRWVGLNKPAAVAERIGEIHPSVNVVTRQILLGGQESSASTDAALVAVGKCDLIIDATADPQIFNLCASVARSEKKALVWGEVFGGGFGGLIMRLRPDVDPVPHAARRQILNWCDERGHTPPEGQAEQYGLSLGDDAPPLIADDADVSLIAAHMTRFALDALTRAESIFPHSAYALGFKPKWIFDAPFDTYPIELTPEGNWGPEKDENYEEQLVTLVTELFPAAPASATE